MNVTFPIKRLDKLETLTDTKNSNMEKGEISRRIKTRKSMEKTERKSTKNLRDNSDYWTATVAI
jgi:hypothetical protein